MIRLTYFGHSAFQLSNGTITLLFDPFFTGNPWKKATPESITCQYIFVSHGHSDHYGDTPEIAKRNNALVISTAEMAHQAESDGCRAYAMHLGGTANFEFGYVRLVPAFHGSGIPGGHAAGVIVNFFDTIVYFAGDTALYSDMKLHGRFDPIDYALLPIGDNFTMGPEDAALAASWVHPKAVIPIHYKTWPVIDKNPQAFKKLTESTYEIPVIIVDPGNSITL